MSLTAVQMTDLRRIMGFPNLGNAASTQAGAPGFSSVFAQWQPYAWMEYRFATIGTPGDPKSEAEEVAIFGTESSFFSSYFTAGNITLAFSTSSSIASTAFAQIDVDGELITVDAIAGDSPSLFASRAAQAISGDITSQIVVIANAIGPAMTLYARSVGTLGNGLTVQATSSDPTLQIAIGNGSPANYVGGQTSGGSNPPCETFIINDGAQTVYGYVPIIRVLEGDAVNVRESLDIKQADVFTPNPKEMRGRIALLHRYRRLIAERLNVPLDPDLVGNKIRNHMRFR